MTRPKLSNTVAGLNHLIADYTVFAQRARAFHWNVEGMSFQPLHALFGSLYDMAARFIDELAERVRQLGQFPTSRLTDYMKDACLKEAFVKGAPSDMIDQLLKDLTHLGEELMELHKFLGDSDPATKMMLETHLGAWEKQFWFLRAHVK